MPFGGDCEYADFDACVADNQDKDDPAAYCATLQAETEDHCGGSSMSAPKTVARENIERSAPFALLRQDGDGGEDAGRILDGYGAVFNRETIIDSWEGRFKETIKPGSMARSFRDTPPRIQFDHGRHPMVGSIPIAKLRSATEEIHPELAPEGGAHIVGRLHNNWLVEPVREAIASESVNGMSFRFSVLRDKWFDSDGKEIRDEDELFEHLFRTWWDDVPDDELLSRELWELRVPEIGPVVWPAYEETSVGVRAREIVRAINGDATLLRAVRRTVATDNRDGREDDLRWLRAEDEIRKRREDEDKTIGVILADDDTRREVARAAIRSSQATLPSVPEEDRSEDAQPESGHPSDGDDAQPESGHPSAGDAKRADDAQPESGHPSEADDAQPESGHPSKMTHSRMGAEADLIGGLLDYAVRVGPEFNDEE